MRRIIIAAAAAAIGFAPVLIAPTAHADYVCTGPGGAPITFVGNSNLCYGGGTLITPAQQQNAPPSVQAAPPPSQAGPPPSAQPVNAPPPATPPALHGPPGGVCGNACGTGICPFGYDNEDLAGCVSTGSAPAQGANPQAINNGVEGGLGNTPAAPAVPPPVVAQVAPSDQPAQAFTPGASDVITNPGTAIPCHLDPVNNPNCILDQSNPAWDGEDSNTLCGKGTATYCVMKNS
jgi:hypothetical protein